MKVLAVFLALLVCASALAPEEKTLRMTQEDLEKLASMNLIQVSSESKDEAKMVIPVHLEVLGNVRCTGAIESSGVKFADGSIQRSAIPIGAVIDWWRPDDSFAIPAGYQICDGSMVTNPNSPMNGLHVPDLRGKFVRGSDEKNIGETGGAALHSHKFTIPEHQHSFAVNFESFVATTDVSGEHTHKWSEFDGTLGANRRAWFSYNDEGRPYQVTHYYQGMLQQPGGYEFPLQYEPTTQKAALYTSREGAHSHNLKVQMPPVSFNTTTPATEICSDEESTLPPFMGLLKLIRVY